MLDECERFTLLTDVIIDQKNDDGVNTIICSIDITIIIQTYCKKQIETSNRKCSTVSLNPTEMRRKEFQ